MRTESIDLTVRSWRTWRGGRMEPIPEDRCHSCSSSGGSGSCGGLVGVHGGWYGVLRWLTLGRAGL